MATSSIDWSAVRAAASVRLAMPRTPLRGRAGERLGSGTGSSLEFEDYRPYTPGDDLRHVDWAAYARSEMLAVRLYREEVAPRLDLVIDLSRSMAVTEREAARPRRAVRPAGLRLHVHGRRHARHHARRRPSRTGCRCPRTSSASSPATRHAVRRSKRAICRSAAARCGSSSATFCFRTTPTRSSHGWRAIARGWRSIQLTLPEEAEPSPEGGRRLVDVEGHGELDVVIDDALIRDYRERFARLRLGLSRAARRVGAPFAYVSRGTPVREMARALAAAGVVEAA